MTTSDATHRQPSSRLPKSLLELQALRAWREPISGPAHFHVEPTDIFVATYPKCGTTWTQQIVHGLRTRGDMGFEEISLVVPWLESPPLPGVDLAGPQVARPRAFKTHLHWERVPKGGRYIHVMRDPADTLTSFYHYVNGWMFEPDSVSVEEFCFGIFLKDARFGRYWEHLRAWWSVRERDDVLLLAYEDMKEDLESAVRRIGAFMGVSLDDELVALVTKQSTFEFMHAHESQFDDHPTTEAVNRLTSLPPEVQTTKVRAGRVGDSSELSSSVHAVLAETWRADIEVPLGIPSYARLRQQLRSSQPTQARTIRS
ncbi:sulfotransferase domain-containing protein [Myxococcus sp. AB025B]|uniref:sulfotransferase domain-containing protein n=1 Tax=Myxococcus sp. AB025B TaxID=2562794 RepID=UPI001141C751|nr:sulfotransferase domain-containing protein [Myxococcus sp. AB025B]